jgi:hypothetical protein
MGWRGKKNGEPLQLAAARFDVFVTIDAGLKCQQRISHTRLGLLRKATKPKRFVH